MDTRRFASRRALWALLIGALVLAPSTLVLASTVSSLSPSSVVAGCGGLTLQVNGSSFSTSSSVLWNGSRLSTTWVSSSTLKASVPAGYVASAGTASISVHTSHRYNSSNTVTFTISKPVATAPVALKITTTSLANGTTGSAYSASLGASGGTAPYVWTMASGSLPAGVSLSTSGVLSGTPTTAGTYSFQVQVKDSASSPQTVTGSLSMVVVQSVVPLKITTTSLANGTTGTAYSASLGASGGTTPYVWTMASGSLPAGVSLSTSGGLSGTPTTAGTYSFQVQVKDSASSPQAATGSFSITTVQPVAALKITTTALPTAYTSTPYSQTLAATGGVTPYQWTLASGSLPTGINLSTAGVVSGTATVTGTFQFTVRLTDNAGTSATATFSLITAAQSSSTGYHRWFSDSSFWNTPIAANPQIDANSAAMVQAAMVAYTQYSSFQNSNDWGIPYIYATSTSKTYNVSCTMYCPQGSSITFPIPSGAQVATGSDHHLVVINGNQELDMWEASYNASNDTWSANVVVVNDITGWGATCAQGQHCTAAVAAGFAALGGLVRPEEIAQGHIDHALHFLTPQVRSGYIACPATNTDGSVSGTSAIPEGARIQLDPSFNVDAQNWPTWEKIIAKALQTYGAYVVDFGGQINFRGVTDQNAGNVTWSSVGVPKGSLLNNFPWGSMRVLQIQSCN